MRIMRSLDVDIANKEKIFTIKGLWLFLSQLLVIGLSFSMFLNTHFSIDSYGAYSDGSINHYLSLGRVVNYIIALLLRSLGINPVHHQAVFIFLTIIFMAVSSALLIKRYCSCLKTVSPTRFILANLAVLISFVNVYILEWYLFPEVCFLYGLGLLFVVIAILNTTKAINFRNLLVGSFFLFLSENIYQINITIFVIFSLTFLLVKNLNSMRIRSLVQIVLSVVSVGSVTMLLNIAIMKLVPLFGFVKQNTRIMSFTPSNILSRLTAIFTSVQSAIWVDGSGFLGFGIMGIFLLIALLLLLSVLIKNRKALPSSGVISIILVLLLNYLVVLFPHLLTSSLWMAPRTIVGIFMFLTSIYLLILAFPLNLKLERVLVGVLLVFLTINVFQISTIGENVFSSNKVDKEFVQLITNEIAEYEEAAQVTVTMIAVAKDAEPQYGYYGTVDYIHFDTNVRALVVDWAIVPAINYYSNRNFTNVKMPAYVYAAYFEGKNWSSFNPDDQLVFIGDTLYLVSY